MLDSYKFKSDPFKHQFELLSISSEREYYAYLMEQGTGKSKPFIDNSAMLYNHGHIQCMIVIAPNGVHRKWIRDDLPLSLPDDIPHKWAIWQASSSAAEKAVEALFVPGKYLRIIALNVESFSGNATKKSKRVPKGVAILRRLLSTFDCIIGIDESSRIKTPNSSRTENIVDLGPKAAYRRIMSGTASPESPLNLFAQFKFLSPSILGNSFYAFKPEYAQLLPANSPLIAKIMRENPKLRMIPQIEDRDPATGKIIYRNLEKLKRLIEPHSYRKTKLECFDLPPKIYVRRYFEMSREQERLYHALKTKQKALFQDTLVTVIQKMTLLMRLSQLVRGYMIDENERLVKLYDDPKKNPAIIEMLDAFEENDDQTIVWCRFKHEVQDVLQVLGEKAVDYYGDTSGDDRERNMYLFKNGHKQYFVGTVDAGGIGLDLNESPRTFFYSNQFSSEKRQQAEDRNHRWGSVGSESEHGHGVLYEDLVCPGTTDEYILSLLAAKKEVSDYMMDLKVVYEI